MNEGEREQKKEIKEEISLQEGWGAGICLFRHVKQIGLRNGI